MTVPGSELELSAWALLGLPEIAAGADLAGLLLAAGGPDLLDGDVLVVSSKIVSKALGLTGDAADREDVVRAQSVRVVAAVATPLGAWTAEELRPGNIKAWRRLREKLDARHETRSRAAFRASGSRRRTRGGCGERRVQSRLPWWQRSDWTASPPVRNRALDHDRRSRRRRAP